jgi:glycosyltransferase involved in cell wall biosynthesis
MIAKNAGATIEKALKSVRFCDEIIVVVDSSSTDATESIARRLADHVEVRDWNGFGPAKRAAVALAKGRWIFSIDADEEVTSELAGSICDTLAAGTPASLAYRIKRRTRFLGRWMLHGDWGRDRVVRLFQKEKAQFTDDPVHESVSAPDPKPILDGWLLHEGDQDISSYLIRLDRYTTLAAESLHRLGRRSSYLSVIVRPLFKFLQAYFIRFGVFDGWQGLVLAWYSAVYVFTKYAKLRHLNRETA